MRFGCAYYGSHFESHLSVDLREIKQVGCDDVVITLSENDMSYFPGKVRLAPEIAKKVGLRLFAVPWGFGNLFGGGTISKFVLDFPESLQIDSKGKIVGMGCYNNEIFKDNYRKYILEVGELGYDGILVDEPTSIDCYCSACKEKYRLFCNKELQFANRDVEKNEEFRKECVVSFVKEMADFVKNETNLITQIAMSPHDFEIWNRVADIPSIDIFGVDPYWLVENSKAHKPRTLDWFIEKSEKAVEISKITQKQSLIWINCWHIPAGREEEIYEGVAKVKQIEPDMIYAWSYKGGLGTYEACDNPLKAWENLINGYTESQSYR